MANGLIAKNELHHYVVTNYGSVRQFALAMDRTSAYGHAIVSLKTMPTLYDLVKLKDHEKIIAIICNMLLDMQYPV